MLGAERPVRVDVPARPSGTSPTGEPVALSVVPVIVVPVYGRLDLTAQCLRAIDDHTYVSVPVLVIDDCGPEPG